jgi:folate-dependent tRNA-U54 methylase TrmFO/GidA
MNINFGIIAPLTARIRKKRERYRAISERAIARVRELSQQIISEQEGIE